MVLMDLSIVERICRLQRFGTRTVWYGVRTAGIEDVCSRVRTGCCGAWRQNKSVVALVVVGD
jgi:hypothetical protein